MNTAQRELLAEASNFMMQAADRLLGVATVQTSDKSDIIGEGADFRIGSEAQVAAQRIRNQQISESFDCGPVREEPAFMRTEEFRDRERIFAVSQSRPFRCGFCDSLNAIPVPLPVNYRTIHGASIREIYRVQCSCGAHGKCRPTPEAAIESWNEPWQAKPTPTPTPTLNDRVSSLAGVDFSGRGR